jgi:multidrug resistance efflux pump
MLFFNPAIALDIYPQVSASIIEIITPGKPVNPGDILVKLDDSQAQLTLQQNFDDAQLNYEQTQELYDRMVASHRDLDIAKMSRDAAKRELDAHKVLIKIQTLELEKYLIKSTVSGIVKQTPNLRNTTNINNPKILVVIE